MFPCESPQIRRAVFFIPGPQSQVTYPLSMPKMAELALSGTTDQTVVAMRSPMRHACRKLSMCSIWKSSEAPSLP